MILNKIEDVTSDITPIIFLINNKEQINNLNLANNIVDFINNQFEISNNSVVVHNLSSLMFVEFFDEDNIKDFKEASRRRVVSIYDKINAAKLKSLTISNQTNNTDFISGSIEGLLSLSYRFNKYFNSADDKQNYLSNIDIDSENITIDEIKEINNIYKAVFSCRDLVNEPVSHLNSLQLVDRIKTIASQSGFKLEVFDKKQIQKEGMGGLLGVNKGSVVPPTFSILSWNPDNAVNDKPIVLVGKGVVYDTGGVNLKVPAGSLDDMKSDMGGAATVIAALSAVATNKIPVHVIGLIPATDNRPGGDAIVPGDILHMHSGSTVEVLNTDAEGRLILADGISFANKYDPKLIMDVATLTGNAAIATGEHASVVMGNADRTTFVALNDSANSTFERLVEFPFWDEYADLLKSDIADIKNLGPREGGAITAGKFLESFTDYPFIHLDIAGTAYVKKRTNYKPAYATGTGVRLIYDFIKNYNLWS